MRAAGRYLLAARKPAASRPDKTWIEGRPAIFQLTVIHFSPAGILVRREHEVLVVTESAYEDVGFSRRIDQRSGKCAAILRVDVDFPALAGAVCQRRLGGCCAAAALLELRRGIFDPRPFSDDVRRRISRVRTDSEPAEE